MKERKPYMQAPELRGSPVHLERERCTAHLEAGVVRRRQQCLVGHSEELERHPWSAGYHRRVLNMKVT